MMNLGEKTHAWRMMTVVVVVVVDAVRSIFLLKKFHKGSMTKKAKEMKRA